MALHTSKTPASTTNKKKITKPSKQAMAFGKASLSGIPPELRNRIYYNVANNTTKVMVRNDKVSDPPLARTCKLFRKEFLPVFKGNTLRGVKSIDARLDNFQFEPLRKIYTRIGSSVSKIHITMMLDSGYRILCSVDDIQAWCKLMDEKNETGKVPRCTYDIAIDDEEVDEGNLDPATEAMNEIMDIEVGNHAMVLYDFVTKASMEYGVLG